ncbi:DedA family protein [Candidatus Gracilibacteria bacterium]|nr:DedA family protein [Candidatus Gracilibacteria bacterium]
MIEFLHSVFQVLQSMTDTYIGIILLMTIESSIVPYPSELIIPVAAYSASQGLMNVWLVMLSGVVGSVLGALINYYLAMTLGRTIIYKMIKGKWGKFFLISEEKLEKSEKLFLKHGSMATFVGRLIFGVRQLISIPAGFAKMPLGNFILYTALGAAVWMPVLAGHGYLIGVHQDFLAIYWLEIMVGAALFLASIWSLFMTIRRRRRSV